MSFLNHDAIVDLIEKEVIQGHDWKCVNTASLDIRLAPDILVEEPVPRWERLKTWCKVFYWKYFTNQTTIRPMLANEVVYRDRQPFSVRKVTIDPNHGFTFKPGTFILGASMEKLNIPDNIGALLRTKSSMGRMGFEHMDAGWIDPGFNGCLTLEYQNDLKHHALRIYPGDRVGQLIFFSGHKVSPEHSYRRTGNYNGKAGVQMATFKEKE
jgi:deoxycytidine triphosphate deaminase